MRDDDLRVVVAPEPVHAVGDDAQRVDVEAGVGLVEDGQSRIKHRHLQNLVALFFAAGEAGVDRALEKVLAQAKLFHLHFHGLEKIHRIEFLLVAMLANRVDG